MIFLVPISYYFVNYEKTGKNRKKFKRFLGFKLNPYVEDQGFQRNFPLILFNPLFFLRLFWRWTKFELRETVDASGKGKGKNGKVIGGREKAKFIADNFLSDKSLGRGLIEGWISLSLGEAVAWNYRRSSLSTDLLNDFLASSSLFTPCFNSSLFREKVMS